MGGGGGELGPLLIDECLVSFVDDGGHLSCHVTGDSCDIGWFQEKIFEGRCDSKPENFEGICWTECKTLKLNEIQLFTCHLRQVDKVFSSLCGCETHVGHFEIYHFI